MSFASVSLAIGIVIMAIVLFYNSNSSCSYWKRFVEVQKLPVLAKEFSCTLSTLAVTFGVTFDITTKE